MAAIRFEGAFTALVTPFIADGSAIDWNAYETLVKAQLEGGISGLVPCGTTGETPTLSGDEQGELVRRTRAVVGDRVPLLVGTGTNATAKSIEASNAALQAGADAVMVVMPYYNKPSQEGLRRHVELIAQAVDAPIVLYNIPGRSVVSLAIDTLLGILDVCPNVVAVKDATGNVNFCQDVLRRVGDRITVMSGDDPLTVPMMSVGARGVISVTSNLYPRQVSAVTGDVLAGRWEDARAKHFALLPVHRALFCEPNPQPIKAALALKGRMNGAVRPPLVAAGEKCRQTLERAMRDYEGT
jgi:4-hydroxy-tetrahydrodipicolinate synthase